MSLLTPTITIQLSYNELDLVMRPLDCVRAGGWQILLRRIQEALDDHSDEPGVLFLEDPDLQRIYRYAYETSEGGYQDRFKVIIKAAFRAGWVQP